MDEKKDDKDDKKSKFSVYQLASDLVCIGASEFRAYQLTRNQSFQSNPLCMYSFSLCIHTEATMYSTDLPLMFEERGKQLFGCMQHAESCSEPEFFKMEKL